MPGNFLSPKKFYAPQQIDCNWCNPCVIQISPASLHSPLSKAFIKSMCPTVYRVGPYDYLNIMVWGHPELSTTCSNQAPGPLSDCDGAVIASPTPLLPILVQQDGSISYPMIKRLFVSGLTIQQIEAEMTKRLAVYIREPQVTVQVAKFRNRNIYVLGEVKHAGQQPLTDKPLSLMEAVATAGLDSSSADSENIYVIRGNYQKPLILWWAANTPQALLIAQHFYLEEDDIIYVCASTLSGWNRFINEFLPSLQSYFLIKNFAG